MIAELNRVQQANLLEMENRLSDYMDQRNTLMEEDMRDRKEHEGRLEKRLEQRDENLMRMIWEIQGAKRMIEGVAVAKEKSFGDEYTFNRVYFHFCKRNINMSYFLFD